MGHPTINLYSLSRWLIKTIRAYVRRHPFFCSSLAIHSAILYFLYSYGSYTVDVQMHQQAQGGVIQSVQKAQQNDMQKRIDDMEKIKRLLERSANKTVSDLPTTDTHSQVDTDDKSGTKSPAELLAKAQEMSQAIKAIEKDIKADELAKLLNISKEEALKKVEEKNSKSQEKSKTPESDEALAVKKLEAEARSALEQRKKDLDAKNSGTKIELALEPHANQQNQKDNSDAKRGSGSQGEGEHGNADGTAKHQGNNKSGSGGNSNGMHGDGLTESRPTRNSAEDDQQHRQEIAEFLIESSYSMGNESNFFDAGMGHIPEVTAGQRKQAGRIIGAGGDFAERIYLNSWYVIGPFKGNSHAELYKNPSYPPEQLIDLDAVYFGKDERILKWQYVVRGDYPFVPPDLAEDAVYYGYTEMSLDKSQDLWMWCGADDDMQVWLNEHLVWAGGNIAKQDFFDTIYPNTNGYRKNWNLTEGKRQVPFQQGRNKLLFKLSNGPNRVGIFASIILTH